MKKITPKVTVACITFNHAPYILKCLEGIFMQVCDFDFEVIIHDDCSTDGTQDIIKEYVRPYKDKVRLILQDVNQYSQGKKPLIDFILPVARGKYIAFCEGDDYWTDPLKLQKQVDFLEKHPNLSFCSHEVERITENDELLMSSEEKTEVLYFERDKIVQNYFPTLSLVFRNIELGYNEDLLKAFNGDAVLVTLLSVHGGAAHLPFIGARYRVHSKGIYSGEAYLNNMVKSLDSRLI